VSINSPPLITDDGEFIVKNCASAALVLGAKHERLVRKSCAVAICREIALSGSIRKNRLRADEIRGALGR